MRAAGLFAGIGGLELGLSKAGIEASLLCELWEPACAVLEDRFPEVDLWRDVRDLKALPQELDLLTAGFPCQDLSQAGSTKGIEGDRSSLVSHVFRLLDTQRVPLILLENVPFMLQLNKGRAMEVLVKAFEERGYRWAYRVVNSLGFLPQRRERVFLLASCGDVDPWDVLFPDEAEYCAPKATLETHAHGFYWTEGTRGLGWAVDSIPTLKNGSTVGIPSPPAILLPSGDIIKPALRDAERLQGFEENWTIPAENRSRKSLRWSLVGNAVSVPVAEWVGKRIRDPKKFDEVERMKPLSAARWPKAAMARDGVRYEVEIGAFPEFHQREALESFLRFKGTPLSERATRGFLSRAEASSLRFTPGFLDRVRSHLASWELRALAAE